MPEDNSTPSSSPLDLDPLETHLEPNFGSAFYYEEWTDELREVVRSYLVNEVPEGVYRTFCDWITRADRAEPPVALNVPIGDRSEQVDFILQNMLPNEISCNLHDAAVIAAPTLDHIVEVLESDLTQAGKDDIALWLGEHATVEQALSMAGSSDSAMLGKYERAAFYASAHGIAYKIFLDENLLPRQILELWNKVNSPAGAKSSSEAADLASTVGSSASGV